MYEEQTTEAGFYKIDGDELLYGPNFVYGPTFTLVKENKDSYQYPVDGWVWANTELEARRLLY